MSVHFLQSYKYQHGVKLPGVASQLANQGYHPSGGLSGNTHGTLQTMSAQVPFAVAAAPNGLTQAPTSVPTAVTSLRNDPSSILHSSTSHPSTPGQSLFVHGFVGQQNMTNQLGQSTLSPSYVAEPQAVGPGIQLGSYNTKHSAQLNGSHNPRAMPHTPLSGAPTPATHPSYAAALPIHQAPAGTHPSFYTNSTIQQPPGHLTASGLPHGMVEFLPAMISTDPNTAQSQFNAASFGQYATHYPSTYDPSVDTAFNTRVRHNTWAGLETNASSHVHGANRSIDPQSYENTFDINPTANSNNNNANNNRVTLASDRGTSTVSQRGTGDARGHMNSTAYNMNSTAPVGSQLPELLEFYSSLPVPDHWLSVCNRYSNSTLPLTGTARATKPDERGFDSRISHWNPIPPPPLANQWSAKHANSMMSSGFKTNTVVHAQNSAVSTAPDALGQRRAMEVVGRPQNSAFVRRGNETGIHKTVLTPRAPNDVPGTNRTKNSRSNQTSQFAKSATNPKRIGSWRPNTSGNGLDGGKPVGHFNPTVDASTPSNLMPSGVECGWIMPSPLVDPTVMRNTTTVQPGGIRGQDSLTNWSGQLTNPLLLTMNPGQLDPVNRPTKLMQPNHNMPFVDSNGMLPPRLPDPSSGLARFNHGLRMLRDVFPTRRSQPVYLFGSREQCSAAVGEILSVCFRECVHGPSAPCLGLLVSHQVYQQLLVGCGRRYFGLLHAATGARVSVTGSPVHLEPLDKQSDHEKGTKKSSSKQTNDSPDRIIVVRGELAAICAAEAYISEQVRMIMARDSVPICLWPLLPHLPPLASSPQSHSATLAAASAAAAANSVGPSLDLPTLNRLALCVALMFWSPSTWNKLLSYVPFGSTVPKVGNTAPLSRSPLNVTDQRRTRSVDRIDGEKRHLSDPCAGSPVASDATDSTVEHASLPPPETRSTVETTEDATVPETEVTAVEQPDDELLDHNVAVDEAPPAPKSLLTATPNDLDVDRIKEPDDVPLSVDFKGTDDLDQKPLATRKFWVSVFTIIKHIFSRTTYGCCLLAAYLDK
ncbi:unnamed protein product [Echinostoma caproni]|uniref:YTH domain-containing protein n=1 Tax=Echinostoma caproni TaxID=27848 RepID=A0A183B9T7_9TREM|nr:unnamed protein product [Echinostoma caproni]